VSDPRDSFWQELEALGEEEVRRRLAAHQYAGTKLRSATQWIEYRESLRSSESIAQSLAFAREANDLARSSNAAALEANAIACDAASSASLSANAARTSNIIAAASATAAIIAIVISIIGIFWHH
jgi:hypothetical protein